MTDLNPVFAYYLAAGLFYLVDLIQKVTSEQRLTWHYIFIRSIYTTFITFLATICWKGFSSFPPADILAELMLDSAICTLGLFFYLKSLKELNFSNVGSLSIIGIVLQQLYYYLIKQNPVNKADILACILMSTGCIVQLNKFRFQRGVLYTFCSALAWTAGYIALADTLQKTTFYWSVPIMELTVLLISGLATLVSVTSEKPVFGIYKKKVGYFLLLGIFLYASSLFNNYSFKYNSLNTISFLQLFFMPVSFMMSVLIFKEKPKRVELVSFISSVLGFGILVLNHAV